MGAFHTLDLETNRDVRIVKEEWDSVALERVKEACDEGKGAEVGAIVCGEGKALASTLFVQRRLNALQVRLRCVYYLST
jgi:protein pelota